MNKINSLITFLQSKRGEMKKSRFKIWLRAFLLVQFSFFFSILLYRDIADGYFAWGWVALTILVFIPVGFLMSRLVPMEGNLEVQAVTLSIDKIYLALIWILVITKILCSYVFELTFVADVIMCIIIGIMGGRLGGIGIRVRRLKIKHDFIKTQENLS